MMTSDFKNTPWISEEYFKENYPEEYEKGVIRYFIGLAVHSDFRGNRYSMALMEYIFDNLPVDAIVGFDHSHNVNPMLHHFIRIMRQGNLLKRTYIDRQHYHVIQRKK